MSSSTSIATTRGAGGPLTQDRTCPMHPPIICYYLLFHVSKAYQGHPTSTWRNMQGNTRRLPTQDTHNAPHPSAGTRSHNTNLKPSHKSRVEVCGPEYFGLVGPSWPSDIVLKPASTCIQWKTSVSRVICLDTIADIFLQVFSLQCSGYRLTRQQTPELLSVLWTTKSKQIT